MPDAWQNRETTAKMIKVKAALKLLIFSLMLLGVSNCLLAANPFVKYFSRLLDETRAEIAIGELMKTQFINNVGESVVIKHDQALSERMQKLAHSTSRPDQSYNVYIIESEMPDEIPMPGGALFVTSRLLQACDNEEKLEFILARNLMHMVLKHPMKLIKNEGFYPRLLNQLKLQPQKRDQIKLRASIRDYLINLPKMDHKKADLQGILLTKSPEKTRKAAIIVLGSFSIRLWPVLPWDSGDISIRIQELEKLKLPE